MFVIGINVIENTMIGWGVDFSFSLCINECGLASEFSGPRFISARNWFVVCEVAIKRLF